MILNTRLRKRFVRLSVLHFQECYRNFTYVDSSEETYRLLIYGSKISSWSIDAEKKGRHQKRKNSLNLLLKLYIYYIYYIQPFVVWVCIIYTYNWHKSTKSTFWIFVIDFDTKKKNVIKGIFLPKPLKVNGL